MQTLQDIFLSQFKDLPRKIGLQVVSEKLQSLGIYTEVRAESLITSILAGETHIEWDDEGIDAELTIDFIDADLARIDEIFKRVRDDLPELVSSVVDKLASGWVKSYRRDWRAYRPYEEDEFELFRQRLEGRWGKGFDALRMLLATCRDFGATAIQRRRKSRAKKGRIQRKALIALHARGCQITAEVICLMENGYADGAMARWRTLHELTIVAFLIEEGGDELAARYLAHRAVDQYKEMKAYIESCPRIGDKPLSKREIASITNHYESAIAAFGPEFRHEYGWAAHVIPRNSNPKFIHLEKAAGKAAMRSYYKFASHNVHAGASGIMVRLSTHHGPHKLIAGASNTGFWEPGQNTAFSIVQLTSTLHQPPYHLDGLTTMKAIVELRDAVSPALAAADRKIGREERAKAKQEHLRKAKKKRSAAS